MSDEKVVADLILASDSGYGEIHSGLTQCFETGRAWFLVKYPDDSVFRVEIKHVEVEPPHTESEE